MRENNYKIDRRASYGVRLYNQMMTKASAQSDISGILPAMAIHQLLRLCLSSRFCLLILSLRGCTSSAAHRSTRCLFLSCLSSPIRTSEDRPSTPDVNQCLMPGTSSAQASKLRRPIPKPGRSSSLPPIHSDIPASCPINNDTTHNQSPETQRPSYHHHIVSMHAVDTPHIHACTYINWSRIAATLSQFLQHITADARKRFVESTVSAWPMTALEPICRNFCSSANSRFVSCRGSGCRIRCYPTSCARPISVFVLLLPFLRLLVVCEDGV
ncbi:hypothetical protein BU24DRAFT_127284 [Aaosphaeria arxii CBS 175.79]|uniref:Uncharacterized protein n=1 Tax=Aaosphaeria arxii CBS 175.79 TaxID=1450172 RepID=A0A6A5Y3J6_9PLEO|nr:uncharacterized protein BU24DRAFT_127284 [Aaosphaeria arxii CBS 175.79]KAF2019793.1 hypothetical protein BU24DRAFT_127284 [Aaosphaeria arxii CBS 175.79]